VRAPGRLSQGGSAFIVPGVIILLALAGLVGFPLFKLVRVSVEQGWASIDRVLRATGLSAAASHSLILAFLVPLFAVPVGSAMAVILRAVDVPGRVALRVIVVLPLIIPQFVLGYSWTQAYGPAGFTDSLLGFHWAGLTGPVGVLVVLAVDSVPLSYLLTSAALATRAQPELERAARMSGANGWVVVRTVTVPLLRPILAAEFVLTFVAALEAFAVPQVLGTPAGFSTVTTRIYSDLTMAASPDAFMDSVTLALGLVVLAAIILVPADIALGPSLRSIRTPNTAGPQQTHRRQGWAGPAVAVVIAAYGLLAVGMPTIALAAAAINRAVGLPPTPDNWTLRNFSEALSRPVVVALGHSLLLATTAATTLTVLGVLTTIIERTRAGRTLGTLTTLAFAIPGSTLAVGLLIAYGALVREGLTLIFLGYLAKFWALAHRTTSAAADRIPPAEGQAARTSGAHWAAAAATVWLPAMWPALVGAWLLVFIAALHEVTISSLLYSFDNETLAVAVLNSEELGDVGRTAALSVVLTAMILLAALIAWLLVRYFARSRAQPAARRAMIHVD